MPINDSVVVVTGGTAGVGRATARAFGRTGARVAILARHAARLEATAAEICACGGRALALQVDVADSEAVDRAASTIESELGPIDIWINNAMVSTFAPIASLTAGEIRRVTEVTYLGAVHGTLAASRRMRTRDRGTIVQVGSTLAYRAIPLQAPYCAAKHALRAFTESLRVELLHDRSQVRLTMVHLPALNTPQFDWTLSRMPGRPRPLAPVFQPEVAADAILYAARHAPRELKVGAAVAGTIWLNKFVPGLIDRVLARRGFQGQQDAQSLPSHPEGNLFTPVEGEVGAHGRFDGEAKARSLALDARTSPAFWTLATALAAAAMTMSVARIRRQ
ncbi:MAG TPA: SDR family oxidoreductase [Vicinamibacterales bacterium]|jgi:NAD(P)-dependent dehydrogenase (short-subunit alcohol dehydrogenase family)|nr:SDR family oxidoreductase [Vicinamibacterales bacterium]